MASFFFKIRTLDLLCFMGVMCLSEFGVDNSQCKIEKEESTTENNWHEIYDCKVFAERLLYHDLNVTPAF